MYLYRSINWNVNRFWMSLFHFHTQFSIQLNWQCYIRTETQLSYILFPFVSPIISWNTWYFSMFHRIFIPFSIGLFVYCLTSIQSYHIILSFPSVSFVCISHFECVRLIDWFWYQYQSKLRIVYDWKRVPITWNQFKFFEIDT